MAIPNDNIIQDAILKLLYNSEDNFLHCNLVYKELTKLFPELTEKEKTERYRESKSQWANRVQFARLHLVNSGMMLNAKETRRALNISQNGYWKLSPGGISYTEHNLLRDSNIRPIELINQIITKLEYSTSVQTLFEPTDLVDGRERTICSIVQRRGQTSFRFNLLDAYNSKCAVSDCDVPETLEAAHIIPYLGIETNFIQNGLLLRADIHTLFDLRLLTINSEDFTVIVSPKLYNSIYFNYSGKVINLPDNIEFYPNKAALNKHRKEANL